ncbi:MAG: zinc ABC transporter substrate-binding protein [Clostridia bacterium]|nr:zinc ABC transporter substrate-binding protein [Clostridia bacterium]
MKKQIIKLIKIFAFCLLSAGILCSCSKSAEKTKSEFPKIVAVGFPQYDLARSVCGNDKGIKMLIRPGFDSHSYEPALSDIIAIEEADVLICNGGESEEWVRKILSNSKNKDLKIISFMETEGIKLYEESSSFHSHICDEGHKHLHELKHHNHTYDEHVWTSPKNAFVLTNEIARVLCEINPDKKEEYQKNAKAYTKRLERIDDELRKISKESSHKLIAVADRFPFLYLAKDYGFHYMALFSVCSSEGDAGPKHIAEMIEEIKNHSVKSVFHIELSNKKMAKTVSEKTGAKPLLLHSCQNVSTEEFESGKTYAELMEQNIKNLKEALL